MLSMIRRKRDKRFTMYTTNIYQPLRLGETMVVTRGNR